MTPFDHPRLNKERRAFVAKMKADKPNWATASDEVVLHVFRAQFHGWLLAKEHAEQPPPVYSFNDTQLRVLIADIRAAERKPT